MKFRMNIHDALLFCCLSALCNRNTGLINAQMIFNQTEGEDFRHDFTIKERESSTKYFCRNDCKQGDILIETPGNRAQDGRYTIRYDRNDNKLYAVITELTRSDAGRYRFGVGRSSSLDFFQDFEIRVRELCEGGITFGERTEYSSTEGGNVTIRCSLSAAERNRKFLCRDECKKVLIEVNSAAAKSGRYIVELRDDGFFDVTIAQLTESDSGRYRCGVRRLTSLNTCQGFELIVTDGYSLPLLVCLTVTVLLAVSLLFLYRWKRRSSADLRTPTSGDMEIVPNDNLAQTSTLEDPTYAYIDTPSYETLDPYSTAHDQYDTLQQQI